MSFDIYYTIRFNKKTNHIVDGLFFGKHKVFDYKIAINKVFDTYEECLHYIHMTNLSFSKVHIRKTLESGGGLSHKDYIFKKGR